MAEGGNCMQKVFEEIVKALEDEKIFWQDEHHNKQLSKAKEVSYSHAIEIVKQAGDRYNGGWILCSSGKLPEECQGVDVTIEETLESGEKKYYTAHSWMQDGVWVMKKNPRNPRVIAWKYPAEPYIPKEN